MDQPTFVEGRTLAVSNGILEIKMTRSFMDRVRQRFGLSEGSDPSDDQIKAFIQEGLERYLDNVESA